MSREEEMSMNILILSAGTRCQLVKYFMQRDNGFHKVVTADCSKYAPALYFSDVHYLVPRMTETDYFPALHNICEDEDIQVILPLQEDELLLIAENRDQFEQKGILVAVSDFSVVKMCRDKYALYEELKQQVPCVETYDVCTQMSQIHQLQLPVLAKERYGAGSVGLLKINNWQLLDCFAQNKDEPLIAQPYMEAEEFGVDVYVDFLSGKLVSVFVKKKLRMRAGETEKSISVKDPQILELVHKVTDAIPLRGPIDIDIFLYQGEYYVLEVNPRFGGGYPHAYECGVNFIKYLSHNTKGKTNQPECGAYMENKVMLKYMDGMIQDEKDLF